MKTFCLSSRVDIQIVLTGLRSPLIFFICFCQEILGVSSFVNFPIEMLDTNLQFQQRTLTSMQISNLCHVISFGVTSEDVAVHKKISLCPLVHRFLYSRYLPGSECINV